MRILGITDGQTSGAAVIEDGRILSAINEERIVRIKMARGFPRKAIQEALERLRTGACRAATALPREPCAIFAVTSATRRPSMRRIDE